MDYESHEWHPLHALSLTNLLRSFLLIFALNLLKEVSFLSFILNFDHKNGPKNLTECFPYLTDFTLWTWKSEFLRLQFESDDEKSSSML